jgi:hypothetical protein
LPHVPIAFRPNRAIVVPVRLEVIFFLAAACCKVGAGKALTRAGLEGRGGGVCDTEIKGFALESIAYTLLQLPGFVVMAALNTKDILVFHSLRAFLN